MSDDARTVKQQRRVARIRRRDQLSLLSKLMAEPAGRQWVYDFISNCHVFHTSFATNALKMAFMEGERSVGIHILADITEAAPDLYLQMLKEANSERSSNERTDVDLDPDTGTDSNSDA